MYIYLNSLSIILDLCKHSIGTFLHCLWKTFASFSLGTENNYLELD